MYKKHQTSLAHKCSKLYILSKEKHCFNWNWLQDIRTHTCTTKILRKAQHTTWYLCKVFLSMQHYMGIFIFCFTNLGRLYSCEKRTGSAHFIHCSQDLVGDGGGASTIYCSYRHKGMTNHCPLPFVTQNVQNTAN